VRTPLQRAGAITAAVTLALPIIGSFEGYRPTGYRDPAPAAYETICYGHAEKGVAGKTYTDDHCTALLVQDAIGHGTNIERCISVVVPADSLAAFISFDFNTGKFCGSTMARKLNAGDLAGACAELSRWSYAGSKQLPGLVRRRAAERKLCEQGLVAK
jgi:lysozyme